MPTSLACGTGKVGNLIFCSKLSVVFFEDAKTLLNICGFF